MDALQREYDRFGPWALELSDEDPPPRLFEPHLTGRGVPLLGLKIPRHVERRNVRPGAHLYDRLVALYEDEILVLERVGDGVTTTTCRVSDIRHLSVHRSLLSGNVHIGLPGRSIDVPYNTVSDKLMQHLVALIRAGYMSRPAAPTAVPRLGMATGGLSFFFQGFLAAEDRAQSAMRLLAVQPTEPVAAAARGRVRRMLFALADKRLLESVHACDGVELRAVSRGQAYAYRWESVYGIETTWIPLDHVRSVSWSPDATTATITLAIDSGGGRCTFCFSAANPTVDAYATYLASLPSQQPGNAETHRLAA
jgi:hypothetical protein